MITLFDGQWSGLDFPAFLALSLGSGIVIRIVAEAFQSTLSMFWIMFKGIIP